MKNDLPGRCIWLEARLEMSETTSERKARERKDLDRKKKKLHKEWKKYLDDSRLSSEEQKRRAKDFTRRGMKVPKE